MNRPIKPHDEIVRVDTNPGEITFQIRGEDRSLASVTLAQPVWTHIQEIGFEVSEAVVSDPDERVLGDIKNRHPLARIPGNLRQLRVFDDEGAKISVIYARAETLDS